MCVCVCVCVFSRFSCVWLFATPWTVAHQVSLSMGFPRQEYRSGLPCPPPGDLPDPGICLLCLLHWKVCSLPLAPPRKPMYIHTHTHTFLHTLHACFIELLFRKSIAFVWDRLIYATVRYKNENPFDVNAGNPCLHSSLVAVPLHRSSLSIVS